MSVPIHKVWINSKHISGGVEVGVVDRLPLEGVDVLTPYSQ